MKPGKRVALGCMRLSTDKERNDGRSIAVLHAALDAGVTLLDTADAYCWDETERGHNERLIARALATWGGVRSDVKVATKGGMVRPGGRWELDGRAKHLTAAGEASCRALGVERLDLYQLHAPDPRVPLSTSVRALASLKRSGLATAIGLCNVTVGQIEEARRITEIDAVQVELSLWHDEHFLSGVAQYCVANRLMLLAYRPLGGPPKTPKTARPPNAPKRPNTAGPPNTPKTPKGTNATLIAIAERHAATPFEIALAWLADLSDVIVPIPGATRVETAQSIARAHRIELTDADRVQLDGLCPAAKVLRTNTTTRPAPRFREDAEVVLVMGLPGAGKSTLAQELVTNGYERLNRDIAGGTLRDLLPALDAALASGASRIVLDNTYVSRKSRAAVIQAATERRVPVRCVWLATSVEDAQVNAATRLLSRFGTLLDEREVAAHRKHDASAFLPTVQFRYQRELEPPDPSEGFSRVDVVPFERRIGPSYVNRAVIVWCDGILMRSKSEHRVPSGPEDVVVEPHRAEVLQRYQEEGFRILGLSWQPEIADGTRTADDATSVFARMNELIGLAIEVEYCPHGAGPPRCWCRKPLPGLGVVLIHRHRLNPAACIYVGDGPQDPGFARRLGFEYRAASDFFG